MARPTLGALIRFLGCEVSFRLSPLSTMGMACASCFWAFVGEDEGGGAA